MSRAESQASITTWQERTFGRTTALHAFDRMLKELTELRDAIAVIDLSKAREECADVLITLYRVAQMLDIDLETAVDHKMATNRARKWVVDATGNGQHE